MTKSTRLIPHAAIRGDDLRVFEVIRQTFADSPGSSRSTWLGGVRNDEGVVYREVALDSFDQLLAFSNRLQNIGFAEEVIEPTERIESYDLTFRKP